MAPTQLSVIDHDLAGLTVTTYAPGPDAAGGPVLLLLDDGDRGEQTDARRRRLAAEGALLVVGVERRGTGIAATDDADRALQWIRSTADLHFGADPSRIALLGIGSGAQVAQEMQARLALRGWHEIEFVVLDHAGEGADPAELRRRLDDVLHDRGRSGAPTPDRPAIDIHTRVEPAFLPVLDRLARWDSTSIDSIRATYREVRPTPVPPDPMVARSDEIIPGIGGRPDVAVRWYRPRGLEDPAPALVYCHGGAYIMGTLDENDERLDRMALELGCRIVSIDYRLAPEHPYPAGLDDAETVWRHVVGEADTLGLDAGRLVLGGASAGAGLIAALCIRIRQRALPQPRLQFLIYPMLDDREVTDAIRAIRNGPGHWGLWHIRNQRLAWAAYHRDLSADEIPVTAAPARATVDDLRGLAPVFLGVGDIDAYVDEVVDYAKRLVAAGVPTELHVYPGLIHGAWPARPFTPRTSQFVRDGIAALRTAFDPGGS